MKYYFTLFLIFSSIAFIFTQNQFISPSLVDAGNYFRKLLQETIRKLEMKQITGQGLPVIDFESFLNESGIGLVVHGPLTFHSGFVVKIEEIILDPLGFAESGTMAANYSEVKGTLLMKNMAITYEVSCDFENYKKSGSVYIIFDMLRFEAQVRQMHDTKEMSTILKFLSINNQNNIVVITYPNDPHFQIIAKTIKRSIDFRKLIFNSFDNWKLTDMMMEATKETLYPDFLYY